MTTAKDQIKWKVLLVNKKRLREKPFCGNSSVVEHHLAKVGVAGSSPVSRSRQRKNSPPENPACTSGSGRTAA